MTAGAASGAPGAPFSTTGAVVAHKDPALAVPPACADESAWFDELTCIDHASARTLLAALRTLYPHDGIRDAPYRRVVVVFDRLASRSDTLRTLLAAFVSSIDKEMGPGIPFVDLSEGYRVTVLRRIEATPHFRFVQRAGVRYLYDDVELWQAFGYEGASYHLGGYVNRGFDDLDWLPAHESAHDANREPKASTS